MVLAFTESQNLLFSSPPHAWFCLNLAGLIIIFDDVSLSFVLAWGFELARMCCPIFLFNDQIVLPH